MFIDTHCHLFNEYYDNIDEIINKCKENNIKRIIVIHLNLLLSKLLVVLI